MCVCVHVCVCVCVFIYIYVYKNIIKGGVLRAVLKGERERRRERKLIVPCLFIIKGGATGDAQGGPPFQPPCCRSSRRDGAGGEAPPLRLSDTLLRLY